MSSRQYILVDGKPKETHDLMEWGAYMQSADRRVGLDTVGEVRVSTVFLGLDHGYDDGEPILFETMVFGGPLDGTQERYASREEAVAGHALMIERVKSAA